MQESGENLNTEHDQWTTPMTATLTMEQISWTEQSSLITKLFKSVESKTSTCTGPLEGDQNQRRDDQRTSLTQSHHGQNGQASHPKPERSHTSATSESRNRQERHGQESSSHRKDEDRRYSSDERLNHFSYKGHDGKPYSSVPLSTLADKVTQSNSQRHKEGRDQGARRTQNEQNGRDSESVSGSGRRHHPANGRLRSPDRRKQDPLSCNGQDCRMSPTRQHSSRDHQSQGQQHRGKHQGLRSPSCERSRNSSCRD
jgi:hypothetical protein